MKFLKTEEKRENISKDIVGKNTCKITHALCRIVVYIQKKYLLI